MAYLFNKTINNWKSWGEVFQSIDAFTPLINEIYDIHGLKRDVISHLTPGSNAVFRVGANTVKIYAPAESGVEPDFNAELAGMRHAINMGVKAPDIICSGVIHDKYDFYYIIMEYIEAPEAGDVLLGLSDRAKADIAVKLKTLTAKMNVTVADSTVPDNVHENVINNIRWDCFPAVLKREAVNCSLLVKNREQPVFVHGDLTSENVLLDDNDIRIIDFADCHIAPYFYEWPPIVFDLFKRDPVLIQAYFGDCGEQFIDTLAEAILIHDFGGGILRDACVKTGKPLETIKSIKDLRLFFAQLFDIIIKN